MKTISEMKNSINEAEKSAGKSEKKAENKAEKTGARKANEQPVSDKDNSAANESSELASRLAAAEALSKEIMEKYQRTLAEFDNFRKRTTKEKATIFSDGEANIVKSLLPIFDSFDRAIASAPEDEAESPAYTGLMLIYKQLKQFMEQNGITEIEACGKEFDPLLHEALAHIDDPERGENEVVDELQKGYKLNDKIIRHSMVRVAN